MAKAMFLYNFYILRLLKNTYKVAPTINSPTPTIGKKVFRSSPVLGNSGFLGVIGSLLLTELSSINNLWFVFCACFNFKSSSFLDLIDNLLEPLFQQKCIYLVLDDLP